MVARKREGGESEKRGERGEGEMEKEEEEDWGTADHCSKGIPRLERGVAPASLTLPTSLHLCLTHAES